RDHVLLAREQLQHRVGLLVVRTQPHRERLVGGVLTGDQGAAADVAGALLRRARGDEVVVQAAARAQAPGEHPAPDLGVGQVQVDHAVDVVALQEELRLAAVAGEAVDHEPVVPVVLAEPLGGHRLGHVVADQFPGRHDAPHLGAELGVLLHVPAEDVTDADVHQVQVHGEQGRLGALAAALNAHDDVFAHDATFPYAGLTGLARSGPPSPTRGRARARRSAWPRSGRASPGPGTHGLGRVRAGPRAGRAGAGPAGRSCIARSLAQA